MLEDGRREVTGDRVKRGGNIVATLTTQSGKLVSLRAPDSTLPFSVALYAPEAFCPDRDHSCLSRSTLSLPCPSRSPSTFSLSRPALPDTPRGACRVLGDPDRGQGAVLTICR